MLRRIISGGQTGADRAALDAALEKQFPIGGSCPEGRMAEDGPIHQRYPLREISGGYRARTKRNVEDADGTAIFYQRYPGGGTEQTLAFCIELGRPYKLIDIDMVSVEVASSKLQTFIGDYDVQVLNVAGPRASDCPAIYDFVRLVITLSISGVA